MRRAWTATTDVTFREARAIHQEYSVMMGGEEKRGEEIAARREGVLRRSRAQRPR
jgi:hypothetical protein